VFRWIERRMPALLYYDFTLRLEESRAMVEEELRKLLAKHGVSVSGLGWRFKRGEGVSEYRMTIRANHEADVQALCAELKARDEVVEYRTQPIGH